MKDFDLNQWTPIRVLHRRTLSKRVRKTHSLSVYPFARVLLRHQSEPVLKDFLLMAKAHDAEKLFIIELECASGTYVKEFVHGDLGRCEPSLTSLFGCPADLLLLDVTAIHLDFPPTLPDPDVTELHLQS
ncbi:hypothetical protein Ciccas_004684 [Cichlidogyrus casuarinus]|uniref:tRNA pseudouridine(55) synthase n=1 Tax=Cichlidogyrus casuarinus TaxID=1844966 RepID=A0ABD2QAV1_9PLAT